MKKIVAFLLLSVCILSCLVGCSADSMEALGEVYNAVTEYGEAVYGDVNETVKEYAEKGTTNDFDKLPADVEEDSDFLEDYEDKYYVTGEEVLALLSSSKGSNLTVIVQQLNEEVAYVNGVLITNDGTPYVEEVNTLEEVDGAYPIDFCGLNGIIRSVISSMPSRKVIVYQYDKVNTNFSKYASINLDAQYDLLILTDEKGNTCGFYCSER